MGVTQTAAQQATTLSTQHTAKHVAIANLAAADGPDRAKYLADIRVAEATAQQARESKTTG